MTVDFCPGTRFVQIKGAAVAVTPDERVYLVRGGRAVELVTRDDDTPDPAAKGLPVAQDTGD
jgi:hypothetical protein